MAISFSCPACDRSVKVKDELAGRKIKCPECGKVIAVPEADELELEEAAEAPPPRNKKKKGLLGKDVNELNQAFNNFDVRRFTPAGWILLAVSLAVGFVCLMVAHQAFGLPGPKDAPIVHLGPAIIGGVGGGFGTFVIGTGILYVLGIKVIHPRPNDTESDK